MCGEAVYSFVLFFSVFSASPTLSVHFFLQLKSFFSDSVIKMQSGKNGVNGPAQNSIYAEAAAAHQPQPNNPYSIYPPHTGKYITMITIISSTTVCQSLHCSHIQRKNRMILSFRGSFSFGSFCFCVIEFTFPYNMLSLFTAVCFVNVMIALIHIIVNIFGGYFT